MKKKLCPILILIFLIFNIPACSFAGVVMLGTRLVINEGDEYGEVKLKNYGDQAELVQVWVDAGAGSVSSSQESVPLIPTPSVFRIGAHSEQSVRINLLNGDLPKDRESLFWFNFLQIFPKGDNAANSMDFSLINAVKIFYRPGTIRSPTLNKRNYLKARIDNHEQLLIIDNSSPYHINLTGTVSYGREKDCQLNIDGEIIKPFSELRKKIKRNQCSTQSLYLKTIEDDGRVSEESVPIY